ncbi:hypothetical protein K440DRAFT_539473 [Wilcoxina mikolae CBS 423.85]|nr:hypothetical protein K440DRAFT_539473 [Wilcoxina mikolae CBS 423.85]
MPYTPPAQSPGASPSSSRSSSFSNHDPRTSSTLNLLDSRNPPRSATYLHKHRRSSSALNPAPKQRSSTAPPTLDPRNSGSIHRSPPPVDNGMSIMPVGAFMSPPDSTQNSSDEEDSNTRRGRDLGPLEDELKQAIKKLPQRRMPSPERDAAGSVGVQVGRGRVPSHQRTRSEPMLIDIAVRSRSGSHSGSISDIEDDAYRIAPAMVRKKSGEVVKSSLKSPGRSRPCSVPSTPTFPPKNVHFDSRIEHVRHFLHSEKPSAVSVGSSPVEGVYDAENEYPFGCDDELPQFEIGLPNFPKDHESRKSLPARLEKVCLSTDKKSLIGTVAVANVAFQKHVVARFTFDYWQTVSEVSAEWSSDVRRRERDDGIDRFVFKIKLAEQAHLEKKTLFFCCRYNAAGQEFWDNNGGVNFQVDFKKTSRTPTRSTPSHLPRSTAARPRSMPEFDLDDEFYSELGAPGSSRPKPKAKSVQVEEDAVLPARRANPAGNAFGNRYDFRNSFQATVRQQPKVPVVDVTDASPPAMEASYFNMTSQAASKPRTLAADLSSTTPPHSPSISGAGPPEIFSTDNFWTHEDKPSIESPSYRELLDNYCFFGSSKATKLGAKPEQPQQPQQPTKKESAEKKIKESLQIFLPAAGSDRCASPQFITSPLNGTSITPPSLSVAQQKSSGNASPIPLNYAGYHHRRRGSGAFRFDAVPPTAIC